jgi:hypothetical protein
LPFILTPSEPYPGLTPISFPDSGLNSWTADEILEAAKQGIKYYLLPMTGPLKPGAPPWQYATKGMYPHVYSNSDDISFTSECNNAGSAFSDLIEFPIIKGGALAAGKNSRTDVGTDRVVFKLNDGHELDPDFSGWLFCGVMTHSSVTKVKALIDGVEKNVLPFTLCA